MSELSDLSATTLLKGYRTGEYSPVEVLESVLERVVSAEPFVAATWAVEPEKSLALAQLSEDRWARQEPCGPLDGVPATIKEMIATEGVPKPVGTAAGDMTPQPKDAPPAARLREAGAILFGKTTNPDFGMLSSGLSSFHKLARNPWDLRLGPGGSSAGAGAAAAIGYGPLHLGTDIGGSLRLPAGWCGIYTLKPSNGRVPIDPPYIGRVAGPMTRTVADAALMMSVLAQPDERDHMSLPPARFDPTVADIDLSRLRIGLMMDAGCGLPVVSSISAAIFNAAMAFAERGAILQYVAPVLDRDMLDGLDRFWRARFLSETRTLSAERYETILPYIRAWVEAARDSDGLSVYDGFSQIFRMREAARDAFRNLDFILSPTAPIVAFPAEMASPLNDPTRPFEHIAFTVPWNMSEHPAASINCGYSPEGLPIGLQIIGRRYDDAGVLAISRAYEIIRPEQMPWPRPWANTVA